MSWLVDLLSGGGLGTIIGSVAGGVQKYAMTKLEHADRKDQRVHELSLHELQTKQELDMQENELMQFEVGASADITKSSFEHDASFKPDTWVDNIRALVRPAITVLLITLAFWKPETYSTYAGVAIAWWFADRSRVEVG